MQCPGPGKINVACMNCRKTKYSHYYYYVFKIKNKSFIPLVWRIQYKCCIIKLKFYTILYVFKIDFSNQTTDFEERVSVGYTPP